MFHHLRNTAVACIAAKIDGANSGGMSDQWGTREQPSEPEPHQLGSEHALLAVGVVSLTVAIVLAVLDEMVHTDFVRGLYSILTGLFVVGMTGWLVRSGQSRVRRQVECHAHVINEQLAELRELLGRPQVTYLPQPKQHHGTRYLSTAVGGQGDTVPSLQRVGLDAETIAAARSLARRIVDGPAEQSSES